jgi:hypothetical protein
MNNQEINDQLFEAREALRQIIATTDDGDIKEKVREALYILYDLYAMSDD